MAARAATRPGPVEVLTISSCMPTVDPVREAFAPYGARVDLFHLAASAVGVPYERMLARLPRFSSDGCGSEIRRRSVRAPFHRV